MRSEDDLKKYPKYPWGREIYTLEGEHVFINGGEAKQAVSALDGETHLGEDGAGASRCFRMVDALTVGGEQDRMKAALFVRLCHP